MQRIQVGFVDTRPALYSTSECVDTRRAFCSSQALYGPKIGYHKICVGVFPVLCSNQPLYGLAAPNWMGCVDISMYVYIYICIRPALCSR